MPIFYGYDNAIFGTQSTISGATHDYAYAPPSGQSWTYSGSSVSFQVRENQGATQFNGDPVNEEVSPQERFGGIGEQVTRIGEDYYQVIWDYTFEIKSGSTTLRVAVIDVDLNHDNDLNDTVGGVSEDGYYLVFPDGLPVAGRKYKIGNIVENDDYTPHSGLGASTVCFAAGTLIATAHGDRRVEDLAVGDTLHTQGNGLQPLLWAGATRVAARGEDAPIVIRKGALGNDRELRVSANHKILIESYRAELLFAQSSVLVMAKDLVNGRNIYRSEGGFVDYHHLLLPQHELIFAEGIPSESFFPGETGLRTLSPAAICDLRAAMKRFDLRPETYGSTVRTTLKSFEAHCLMAA